MCFIQEYLQVHGINYKSWHLLYTTYEYYKHLQTILHDNALNAFEPLSFHNTEHKTSMWK